MNSKTIYHIHILKIYINIMYYNLLQNRPFYTICKRPKNKLSKNPDRRYSRKFYPRNKVTTRSMLRYLLKIDGKPHWRNALNESSQDDIHDTQLSEDHLTIEAIFSKESSILRSLAKVKR
jgi:hypothetical protein